MEKITASESYQLTAATVLKISAKFEAKSNLVVVDVDLVGTSLGDSVWIHWGVGSSVNEWKVPTEELAEGSKLSTGAAQNIFVDGRVRFNLSIEKSPKYIQFVIHVPPKQWLKNGNSNFVLPIELWLQDIRQDRNAANIRSIVDRALGREPLIRKKWTLGHRTVAAAVSCVGESLSLAVFVTNFSVPILHWGFLSSRGWVAPDPQNLQMSYASRVVSKDAMETDFQSSELGHLVMITYSGDAAAVLFRETTASISFVIRDGREWLKNGNSNFVLSDIPLLRNWQESREAFSAAQLKMAQKAKEDERRWEEKWRQNLVSFRKTREQQRIEFDILRDQQLANASVKADRPEGSGVNRQSSFLFLRRMSSQFALSDSNANMRPLGFKEFSLEDNFGELQVTINAELIDSTSMKNGAPARIHVTVEGLLREPCVLHWALLSLTDQKRRHDWVCPPVQVRPEGTIEVDPSRSCQTPFATKTPSRVSSPNVPFCDVLDESEYQTPKSTSSVDDGCLSPASKIPSMAVHLEFPAVLRAVPDDNQDEDSNVEKSQNFFVVADALATPTGTVEPWGITAVVKSKDRWLHANDGSDMQIAIVPSPASVTWKGYHSELAEQIIEAEAHWGHMTLMHRFNLLSSLIEKWQNQRKSQPNDRPESQLIVEENVDEDDVQFWSWLQTWIRFSQLRLLDWQRNFNTKPRDLTVATRALSLKVTTVWVDHPTARFRPLVRNVLSMLSRGGDRGQQIRDEILVIMHKHHISEQNHQMYEQWHQKLHNNTTPDDVGICSAILAFLRSNGDLNAYRNTLASFGLSVHRLASYERPIRADPFVPNCDRWDLISDLEKYLDILKDVHDALDLSKSLDYAKPYLSGDAQGTLGWAINMTQSQNDAHTTFQAIADGRRMCHAAIRDASQSRSITGVRDLLFLDFSLETHQSLSVQRMGGPLDESQGNLWRLSTCRPLVKQLAVLLGSVSFHRPADLEAKAIVSDWHRWAELSIDYEQNQKMFMGQQREAALLLMSLVDRISRWVGSVVGETQNLIGPKCEFLAKYILGPTSFEERPELPIFVEEIVRSSALFAVSVCLRRIEPAIRTVAEMPPWQLISVEPREVFGRLRTIDRLINVQDVVFSEPTILLSGAVSGEEEIPEGVVAIVVRSSAEAPDILSHVAVRARNSKVPLAVCYDPEIIAKHLKPLVDQYVRLVSSPDKGTIDVTRSSPPDVGPPSWDSPSCPKRKFDLAKLMLDENKISTKYVISSDSFDCSTVGGKSKNLANLATLIDPAVADIPSAVALPFGTFQKTIFSSSNKDHILPELHHQMSQLDYSMAPKKAGHILREINKIILTLNLPPELADELTANLEQLDFQGKLNLRPEDHWDSILSVWASMFAVRPWISLRRANRDFADLNMAVLVQELVPSSLAFVLHSRNPFGTDPDEMYGEMVVGLGETLVGNYAGRALSWSMGRDREPKILSFFSKSITMSCESTLIFRSDSNAEDLDGFAGAGLFESVTVVPPTRRYASYHGADAIVKRLIRQRAFRQSLLSQVGQLAFQVGEHFKDGLVDVEGVVVSLPDEKHKIVVVQARPQV